MPSGKCVDESLGAVGGVAAAAFSPGSGLLAVTDLLSPVLDARRVSVFSVASDGALAPVSGSPFATGVPGVGGVSPSGGRLATANSGDNTVSVFSVASDGALTQVTGSPVTTGNGPSSVAFSPSGGLLAIAGNEATATAFVSAHPARRGLPSAAISCWRLRIGEGRDPPSPT